MKRCPQCNREEPNDGLVYCRKDGTPLISQPSVGPVSDEDVTRNLPAKDVHTTAPTTVLKTSQVSQGTQHVKTGSRHKYLMLAIVLAVLLGCFCIYLIRSRSRNQSTRNSIAVLPFVNASGDPNMEYLSDGISESLINSLSQLPNMRVLARTTTFSFKGKDLDAATIGRQLGVNAVLTGRVVQLGDNLTVQADLINVEDGSQLWGDRYQRKPTDVIAVQEEIAREIVDKLRLKLNSAERERLIKRYTENIEAYRAYLKGRYEWNKRSADGLKQAITFFDQAIALDPTYALAHAGLADAYALYPQFANAPFEESLTKAKAESLKALELDDQLAEAHISLANVKQSLWEWADVEEEYKRGLALNPNYATGHQWYSEYLLPAGRIDEAEREIKVAQQLDPMSMIINARVGMTTFYARRYQEAERQLRDALQFGPDFILSNLFLFNTLYEQGKLEEAIPFMVTGAFNNYTSQERANFESQIRSAYAGGNKKRMMEKVRDLLKDSPKHDYGYTYLMARVLNYTGDTDGAFLWLNRAADVKHPAIPALRVEPAFDNLRSDPRFQELMKRVGM